MKPLAFISHSKSGGAVTSAAVREKLNHPHLGLETFYFSHNIVPGDDLDEKIIHNIVNTDILIGIIDSDAWVSEWVEWEHKFCKERNLIRIPIIFQSIWEDFKQNKISFLDNSESAILYNSNRDDMLEQIYVTIRNHKSRLQERVNEKQKIQITLNNVDQTKDTITISGQVKTNGQVSREFNSSKIYLYRRNFEPTSIPIKCNKLKDVIDLDENGKFLCTFKLSKIFQVDRTQKLFFEIKFNDKSKIATTSICPDDTNTSDISPKTPPSAVPSKIPTNERSRDSSSLIQNKIKPFSSGTFSSIPKKIKEHTIDRNQELSQIIDKLGKHDKIVVTGNKGSGKSVILCELYDRLKESKDILFLRCDDYLHIQNMSELEKILSETRSLYEIIQENYSDSNKLWVFFDSLDVISRNSRVFEIFKRFLRELWGTNRVKTVCSVRSYDYEYSHSISSTDWGTNFKLGELSDEQLKKTLRYLGNPQISEQLLIILKNPLNLKLLAKILEKSNTKDLRSIISEIGLYNEHWKEYVEKSEKPSELKNILFLISKEMTEKQRLSVVVSNRWSEKILALASSASLVEKDSDTNTVQFFHHAYFDYVVSRYMLENFENLDAYIVEQKYNIFLRPTITFTLSILQMKDEKLFLNNVKWLLSNDEIKYYWKFSVLHVFSKFQTDSSNKVEMIGKLFSENLPLRQHFLRESEKSKNQFWFEIWQDSFIQDWAGEHETYNQFLLDYMKSILTKVDQSNIFTILQTIVEKNLTSWTKKTAVEIASELDVEKSQWYLSLSKHSDSHVRWGVVESLENLISSKTANLSKIFSNIFLFKEESNDTTSILSSSSLTLQSTKRQDNSQVIWGAGEIFPKLLEKNPSEFILSACTIMEEKKKDYLKDDDVIISALGRWTNESTEKKDHLKDDGVVIEDGGYIWYEPSSSVRIYEESKLLTDIEDFFVDCNQEELKTLIPILTNTRLATLHKIALTAMLSEINFFKEEILSEILNPKAYMIATLEGTIKNSIKRITPLLTDSQLQSVLKCIMEIGFNQNQLGKEEAQRRTKSYQARFLAVIPSEKLSSEQREIVNSYSYKETIESPRYGVETTFEPSVRSTAWEGKSLTEIIDSNLGKNIEEGPTIELLVKIYNDMEPEPLELDSSQLSKISDYVLSNVSHENPRESSDDDDESSLMLSHDTIRGLTSQCLIKLYQHTKNTELIEFIEKLSNDPVNIVRGNVARNLRYLYVVNPALALQIAEKYSKESDNRVQFYLQDIVSVLSYKYPQEAIDIIQNIAEANRPNNKKLIRFYTSIITYLALIKHNDQAKSFLNNLIKSPDFPDTCREDLPFILKESYLHNKLTQDDALGIFLVFLDSENHVIREKATFFLLVTLNDEKRLKDQTSDVREIINKIGPHLDKISKEINRDKGNLRIIEHLVKFLKKNWEQIPERSLKYLKSIAASDKPLEFHSWIADSTILILNGLFRNGKQSVENKEICMDILDKFVMAGWPSALELLEIMERPD